MELQHPMFGGLMMPFESQPKRSSCLAKNNEFLRCLALLGIVLTFTCSIASAKNPRVNRDSDYLMLLYQRIVEVGKATLETEDALLFRLENKRPVEVKTVVAKIFSARRQIRALRSVAHNIEGRIPGSDLKTANIQSLKFSFARIRDAHRKNMEKLKKMAGSEIMQALEEFAHEQSLPSIALDSDAPPFPAGTMDDFF